ncbi:hypothetical protein [Halolamina salifodinae]|uniref:Uncharacterized protein n=1 Tax=Halolamina salifodinae TaxID=1202767 RepID=A0A8T4GXS8_9EURY|nr:hypothetical protein [Halolamina salifodinae]MBP1986992.1 hypothetical protein [Halolamina salifodinae]
MIGYKQKYLQPDVIESELEEVFGIDWSDVIQITGYKHGNNPPLFKLDDGLASYPEGFVFETEELFIFWLTPEVETGISTHLCKEDGVSRSDVRKWIRSDDVEQNREEMEAIAEQQVVGIQLVPESSVGNDGDYDDG